MKLSNYTINEQIKIVYDCVTQKFSEVGGYEFIGVFQNGELMCSDCMERYLHIIIDSVDIDIYDSWRITDIITEAELEYINCPYCGKHLGYWE